jgi:hypothetical protein
MGSLVESLRRFRVWVAAGALAVVLGTALLLATPSVSAHPFGYCHATASGFYILKFGAAAEAHERLHEINHERHAAGQSFSTHIDDYPATAEDAAYFEETGRRRCVSPPPHDWFHPRS